MRGPFLLWWTVSVPPLPLSELLYMDSGGTMMGVCVPFRVKARTKKGVVHLLKEE